MNRTAIRIDFFVGMLILAGLLAPTVAFGEAPDPAPALPLLTFSRGPMYSAQARGRAYCRVMDTAAASADKFMRLGDTFPGGSAETITPGDPRSAEIALSGNQNDAVNIVMPSRIRLRLDGSRSEDSTIDIEDVSSNVDGSGTKLNSGSLTIAIGATRPAIPLTQKPGPYSGSLSVDLVHP